METPNYFADADANFADADFVIFGVPFDKTSTFRKGSKKGPIEIRKASWNFETYNFFKDIDIKDIKIHDYGDLEVLDLTPAEMVEKVKNFTNGLIEKGKFPIALGGEHSISSGIVSSFPRDIAVLSLDAHMDFRNIYENEKFNHACVMKRILDHIDIKNIAILGVISAEKEEYIYSKNKGLFFIDSFEIKDQGIKKVINKTKNYLKDKDIYLTIDIDVIDPAYAPGTGTPEPFGITPFDAKEIIESFSDKLVGFDIVEVNPEYDNGQTAVLACKLLRTLIESVHKSVKKD